MRLLTQILILLLFQSILIQSQITQQWTRTYNGPANDEDSPIDILTDSHNNVYTIGNSKNSNHVYDIVIVKYDSMGTQKWTSSFLNSQVTKSTVDQAGNIYISGINNSTSNPLVFKIDGNGNTPWSVELNPNSSIYGGFNDIKIDNNGNIFAVGCKSDSLIATKINSTGNIIWTTYFKNPDPNFIRSVANKLFFDQSGNILICGYTGYQSVNGINTLLIKLNGSGILQWYDTFDWVGQGDSWEDILTDNASNIYVTGISQDSLGIEHSITRKYNSAGTLIWNIIDPNNSRSAEIKKDRLGNIYLSGFWEISSNYFGVGIRKLNHNGVIQWTNIVHNTFPEFEGEMAVDDDCNLYLSKISAFVNNTNYSKIVKYNSNGNFLDSVSKTGNPSSSNFRITSLLTLDDEKNIYYATSGLGNPTLNDFYTIKYSQSNCSVSGTVRYKDNNQPVSNGFVKALYYDYSTSSILTLDSTVINPDGTYSFTHFPPHDSVDIMYYQNDDALDFVPTYYPSTIDWKLAVKIYATQNLTGIDGQVYRINNTTSPYIISGQNLQSTIGINDAIIYAKIGNEFKNYGISTSNGNYVTTKLPAGSYTLTAYRMGFNEVTQNVMITNNSLTNVNFNFGSPIGIQSVSTEIPAKFNLYQNYPNPFNPSTTIKFDMPKDQSVKVIIYDIMGREVTTLVNEELKAGTYNMNWDASNFASGVYFYRIETNSFSQTKKLLLLK